MSNLPEEIYRERWNQIDKDEKEEFRYLKIDTIEKLSLNKIRFFDTFDIFLKINFGDAVFKPENFKELQEMEKFYREKQLWVLDKLLNFSFFKKPDFFGHEMDREKFGQDQFKSANSEIIDRDHDHLKLAVDLDREALKTQINDIEYFGREKKLTIVKLTKYLSAQTDFSQTEKKNIALLNSLPCEKLFKLTEEEINKILKSKNHKCYYNEEEVFSQFNEVKSELLKINDKIDLENGFGIKSLNDHELEVLMKATSFSMNSIHFMQKFEKSNYFIGPNDVLFILNKIK